MLQVQGKAQACEQHFRIGLGVPAVQIRELALQFGGANAVRLGEVLFLIERFLLRHDVIKPFVAHDDGLKHLVFIELKVVLLEHGHALAGGDGDIAGRRLQLAREQLEECRLARAVGADDAIAVTGCKLDVDVLEKRLPAIAQGDVLCCDHGL